MHQNNLPNPYSAQYYNPEPKEKPHPCLAQQYAIEGMTNFLASEIDIAREFSSSHWQEQFRLAAEREATTAQTCRLIATEIWLSGGTMPTTTASQSRLAERTGLAERTVRRGISAMRKVGILFVTHRYNKDAPKNRRRISSKMKIVGLFDRLVRKAKRMFKVGVEKYPAKTLQDTESSQLLLHKAQHPDIAILDTSTGEILPDSYLERLRSDQAVPIQGG